MDRLISLFREASDDARGRPPDLPAGAQPGLGERQPMYFMQLMEYLRQQKAEAERGVDASSDADGEDVIGYDDDDRGRETIGFDEDTDMLIAACDAHR